MTRPGRHRAGGTWTRRLAGLAAFAGLAWFAPVSLAAPAAQTIQQPRAFGHVIGDMLSQRLLLQVDGHDVTPAALPPADRVGLWLERRTPRIERDPSGRPWLVIEHQVINAPRSLTETRLPALTVPTRDGAALVLPAWPIRIGPITPAEPPTAAPTTPPTASPTTSTDAANATALLPDRKIGAGDAAPLERQRRAALVLLAAVLLAWAGWWAGRGAIEARRLPFASAWRQLRRLDADDPQAWRALHRALNASAGQVVQGSTLAALLNGPATMQALRPLQAELEDFFRASDARFFAAVTDDSKGEGDGEGAGRRAISGSTTPTTPTRPTFPLHRLARALRAAERRGRR